MMVRGVESLVVSDEHDLSRALPTPNSDSPDQRDPRGEVPVAESVGLGTLPATLACHARLSAGRIGRRQDDAHGGALLLRPQVRRGTELVRGGALVRRTGRPPPPLSGP